MKKEEQISVSRSIWDVWIPYLHVRSVPVLIWTGQQTSPWTVSEIYIFSEFINHAWNVWNVCPCLKFNRYATVRYYSIMSIKLNLFIQCKFIFTWQKNSNLFEHFYNSPLNINTASSIFIVILPLIFGNQHVTQCHNF
jgi:hypothetical protein